MQTWEYAPQFAIRTYAFISPFLIVGQTLKYLLLTKFAIFVGIRCAIAFVAAISHTFLINSFNSMLSEEYSFIFFIFFVTSPGIFFSSSSLLPSSICSSLVSLSVGYWFRKKDELCILFGCIAVLWSGWPFVGLIFAPLGLHILYRRFMYNGMYSVLYILTTGVVLLVTIGAPAALIDIYYYDKW